MCKTNGATERVEEPINFEELVAEFKEHYRDFDESLKDSEYTRRGSEAICYVTFGITGAGKSTTIARLISDLSQEEFVEIISNRTGDNKRYCEISGIAIGHLANSTTVVPKVYTINGMHFCDMPGFAEHNRQKKVTIDILQKCFLTRLTKTKLVVVLEAQKIFETSVETLIHHYHKPLSLLFGDQYRNAIGHLYFVLTKNEDPDLDSEKIEYTMMKTAKAISKDSHLGGLFLNRIGDRHILVDLDEDGREELQEKIFGMIRSDEVEQQSIPRARSWKIDKLEASGNLLNKMCVEHIAMVRKVQAKLVADSEISKGDLDRLQSQLAMETSKIDREMRGAIAAFRNLCRKQRDLDKAIDHYPAARKNIDDTIRHLDDLLAVHKKQNELFGKHFVDKGFVTMRCDASWEIVPKRKRDPIMHSVNIKAHLHGVDKTGKNTERLTLIMEHEDDDNALKGIIGRGNSLIPSSIKDIRMTKHEKVLYNSYTNVNDCGVIPVSKGEELSLQLTRDKPFKVYMFVERPFKGMEYYDEFKQKFAEEMNNDRSLQTALQEEGRQLDLDHEANVAELKEIEKALKVATKDIAAVKKTAMAAQKTHREKCGTLAKRLTDLSEDIRECKESKLMSDISDIGQIFCDNSIQSDLKPHLDQFNMAFPPLERSMTALLERLNANLESDNEDLSRIVAKDATLLTMNPEMSVMSLNGSIASKGDTASVQSDISSV